VGDDLLFVLRRAEGGWKISAYMFQPQPEAAGQAIALAVDRRIKTGRP